MSEIRPGDTVLVRMPVRPGANADAARLRPAMVVQVWSATCANVVVTLDGKNDADLLDACRDTRGWQVWLTSVTEGEGVHQFHRLSALDVPVDPVPAVASAALPAPSIPEPAPAPAKKRSKA